MAVDLREPPQAEYNLFLGLLLDEALFRTVTRRVQLSCQKHGLTGKPIAPERLHVSLLSFDPSDEEVQRIQAGAGAFRFPPFELTFDVALSFRNRRATCPFVLTCEHKGSVHAFHAAVHAWFSEGGEKSKKPSFTPHMTLVWDQKMIPKYVLERPLSWTVRDFALIRSHVGKSRYDILGRWPLLESEA